MQDPRLNSRERRALPAHGLPGRSSQQDVAALVSAARGGDSRAWSHLVRRFEPMLRRVARSYRLADADADEIVQETWLSLLTAIYAIRDPAAIGGWLTTATRRNAMRRRQMHVREHLTDDPTLGDDPGSDEPVAVVLDAERRTIVANAVATLPDRQRRLLTVLLTQPSIDYREVGRVLNMPVGSIGPIRGRALARLASDAQLCALNEAPPTRPTA